MTDKVEGWSHIVLEGFCMRHCSCSKDKYHYRVIDYDSHPWKTEKINNLCYDPNYRTPKKPKYCRNMICKDCWDNDCPHLGTSTPDDDEYEDIMKKIDELYRGDDSITEAIGED